MKIKLILSVLSGFLSVYATSTLAYSYLYHCEMDENAYEEFDSGTISITSKIFPQFEGCVHKFAMSLEKKSLEKDEEKIFDSFADKITGDYSKDIEYLTPKEKKIYDKVYLDRYERMNNNSEFINLEFKHNPDQIIDKSRNAKILFYINDNSSEEAWKRKKEEHQVKKEEEIKRIIAENRAKKKKEPLQNPVKTCDSDISSTTIVQDGTMQVPKEKFESFVSCIDDTLANNQEIIDIWEDKDISDNRTHNRFEGEDKDISDNRTHNRFEDINKLNRFHNADQKKGALYDIILKKTIFHTSQTIQETRINQVIDNISSITYIPTPPYPGRCDAVKGSKFYEFCMGKTHVDNRPCSTYQGNCKTQQEAYQGGYISKPKPGTEGNPY